MTGTNSEAQDTVYWAALKEGNTDALSRLYRRYYQSLYEYGMRHCLDKELVQDSIQDLFIKLWVNRKTLGRVKRLKPYLLVALRSILFNKLKPLRVGKSVPLKEDQHDFQVIFSAETAYIKGEEALQQTRSLQDALNRLSPRQKEIIYLRYFEELGHKEIAAVMNIPVKAAYKLLSRALDSLRTILNISLAALLGTLAELKMAVIIR